MVARGGRALSCDEIPADGVANDVDAEPVELVEPRLERAGTVEKPGVVLDPHLRAGRSLRRARPHEHDERGDHTAERLHRPPLLAWSSREMSSFALV